MLSDSCYVLATYGFSLVCEADYSVSWMSSTVTIFTFVQTLHGEDSRGQLTFPASNDHELVTTSNAHDRSLLKVFFYLVSSGGDSSTFGH